MENKLEIFRICKFCVCSFFDIFFSLINFSILSVDNRFVLPVLEVSLFWQVRMDAFGELLEDWSPS